MTICSSDEHSADKSNRCYCACGDKRLRLFSNVEQTGEVILRLCQLVIERIARTFKITESENHEGLIVDIDTITKCPTYLIYWVESPSLMEVSKTYFYDYSFFFISRNIYCIFDTYFLDI